MKKRITIGIAAGFVAGIIDVVPMIINKLPIDSNLSAFSMWVICGFLISVVNISLHPVLKGLIVSFLVLTPCLILIAWKEPMSLIPISIMTLLLGSTLGYTIEKISGRKGK
jgi:hypothetical protein